LKHPNGSVANANGATIAAYPAEGGSYTVARENLGDGAGLLAAVELMVDYVLTAAVGISAGVGALVSAIPGLQAHTLAICLWILLRHPLRQRETSRVSRGRRFGRGATRASPPGG
jgi:hypothetical protein